MQDLEEVKQLMDILLTKIGGDQSQPFDIMQQLKFDYYHSEKSCSPKIKLSSEMEKNDPRFNHTTQLKHNLTFADKASFTRGCIKISYVNNK